MTRAGNLYEIGFDEISENTPSEDPSPEECAIATEMTRKMREALTGRERRIFDALLAGESVQTIAEREGITVGTARNAITEMRKQAREALK